MKLSTLASSSAVGLTALANVASAVHMPLSGKRASGVPASGLARRATMSGATNVSAETNVQYTITTTLGGEQISLLIDTGSSDLFTTKKISNAQDTKVSASVSYASGGADGEVYSSTFHFADYVIPSQYYIYAPNAQGFSGVDGLIGLGPALGSEIRNAAGNKEQADPPLDRIFKMDSSTDNFIAILLNRSDDPDEPFPGDLSIAEVLTSHKAILDAPKHDIAVTDDFKDQPLHWQTYLDENGIKGPDGTFIPLTSQVKDSKHPKNATVVFDTGFTFPQVTSDVAEALYKPVQGSALKNVSGLGEVWTLPCDADFEASFYFGGVEFPIHPLDLNFEASQVMSNAGDLCFGAFQPFSFDRTTDGIVTYDMILGMAFLRNAYLLIDFGKYTDVSTPSEGASYIQLLPLTNATEALADFKKARAGEKPSSTDDDTDLFTTSSSSSKSSSSKSKSTLSKVLIGAIIAAVVGLILVGLCFWFLCRRRRTNTAPVQASYAQTWQGYGAGPAGAGGNADMYRPLNEPSPAGADEMRIAPGAPASTGYQPGYGQQSYGQPGYGAYQPGAYAEQQYSTAWDHRA
ncbi:acid protease [Coniophora puteana RWD-64-598 SS2]|uniref:Acid protease n=1 Tax=Coniophora puteana (strain RWD-64-598) TaxID=741705 RepID=R7SEX0_CONPW|nr:acid protease [Coniophora puteana RWD-64-598 SS2]EIW74698.1 acid protease [Coniophora puteana RWD-64-598 SS2]